ncbi:hypothetical protein EYF80_032324 [Liparis tanakae]|uniref:Uncharacterized protein n=1 Tax=Liparis tanakae TaxID=230148 RepID=A0A4Z2GW84_9TELE|nr:hypothetical protein EYF80_032324 [Liparis tanakae]
MRLPAPMEGLGALSEKLYTLSASALMLARRLCCASAEPLSKASSEYGLLPSSGRPPFPFGLSPSFPPSLFLLSFFFLSLGVGLEAGSARGGGFICGLWGTGCTTEACAGEHACRPVSALASSVKHAPSSPPSAPSGSAPSASPAFFLPLDVGFPGEGDGASNPRPLGVVERAGDAEAPLQEAGSGWGAGSSPYSLSPSWSQRASWSLCALAWWYLSPLMCLYFLLQEGWGQSMSTGEGQARSSGGGAGGSQSVLALLAALVSSELEVGSMSEAGLFFLLAADGLALASSAAPPAVWLPLRPLLLAAAAPRVLPPAPPPPPPPAPPPPPPLPRLSEEHENQTGLVPRPGSRYLGGAQSCRVQSSKVPT